LTDASGSFTVKLVLPKDAVLGIQYIQINGYNSADKVISSSVSISFVKAKEVSSTKSESGSINFATNSSVLTSANKVKLQNLIAAIKTNTTFNQFTSITLSGFATPTRNLKADKRIALARATAVKKFLIDKAFTGEIIVNPEARGSERNVTFVIRFTSKS
jgi:outer membrane protein OmpA-like peptidoglycan-associated protein